MPVLDASLIEQLGTSRRAALQTADEKLAAIVDELLRVGGTERNVSHAARLSRIARSTLTRHLQRRAA